MRIYKKISRKIFNYMKKHVEKVPIQSTSTRSSISRRAYELMLGIIRGIDILMVGSLEIFLMVIIHITIRIPPFMRRVRVWRTNPPSTGMLTISPQCHVPPTLTWVTCMPRTRKTQSASLSRLRTLRSIGNAMILERLRCYKTRKYTFKGYPSPMTKIATRILLQIPRSLYERTMIALMLRIVKSHLSRRSRVPMVGKFAPVPEVIL